MKEISTRTNVIVISTEFTFLICLLKESFVFAT